MVGSEGVLLNECYNVWGTETENGENAETRMQVQAEMTQWGGRYKNVAT